jgi:rRNA maturation protein Rpf1
VVTFHNQRDFLFVRHHRYVFDQKEKGVKARLQVRNHHQVSWDGPITSLVSIGMVL